MDKYRTGRVFLDLTVLVGMLAILVGVLGIAFGLGVGAEIYSPLWVMTVSAIITGVGFAAAGFVGLAIMDTATSAKVSEEALVGILKQLQQSSTHDASNSSHGLN